MSILPKYKHSMVPAIILIIVALFSNQAVSGELIREYEPVQKESKCFVDPQDAEKMYCKHWCRLRDQNQSTLTEDEGWNCDDAARLDGAVRTYNLSNPNSQIQDCTKGTRGATGFHLADCEKVGLTTVLALSNLRSKMSCIEDCRSGNGQDAGGPYSNFITSVDSLMSTAQYTDTDACEGYGSSCGYINNSSSPWISVTDGNVSHLISMGYSYMLNISAGQGNGTPGFTAYCTPLSATSVDITLQSVNFSMRYDVSHYGGSGLYTANCFWTLTLVEYLNGQPTGETKSASVSIEAEHVNI